MRGTISSSFNSRMYAQTRNTARFCQVVIAMLFLFVSDVENVNSCRLSYSCVPTLDLVSNVFHLAKGNGIYHVTYLEISS